MGQIHAVPDQEGRGREEKIAFRPWWGCWYQKGSSPGHARKMEDDNSRSLEWTGGGVSAKPPQELKL